MGSAASKAARDQVRRYPKTHKPAGTQIRPEAKSRQAQREPIEQDNLSSLGHPSGRPVDADIHSDSFSQRLQQMGVVQPNPTFSPSSIASRGLPPDGLFDATKPLSPPKSAFASSPILSTFEARGRLQRQAETEIDDLGSAEARGRRFVDMRRLLDAIRMRENGASTADIERRFGLGAGLLDKLGRPGVISHIASQPGTLESKPATQPRSSS